MPLSSREMQHADKAVPRENGRPHNRELRHANKVPQKVSGYFVQAKSDRRAR